jgi:hypothetical protein
LLFGLGNKKGHIHLTLIQGGLALKLQSWPIGSSLKITTGKNKKVVFPLFHKDAPDFKQLFTVEKGRLYFHLDKEDKGFFNGLSLNQTFHDFFLLNERVPQKSKKVVMSYGDNGLWEFPGFILAFRYEKEILPLKDKFIHSTHSMPEDKTGSALGILTATILFIALGIGTYKVLNFPMTLVDNIINPKHYRYFPYSVLQHNYAWKDISSFVILRGREGIDFLKAYESLHQKLELEYAFLRRYYADHDLLDREYLKLKNPSVEGADPLFQQERIVYEKGEEKALFQKPSFNRFLEFTK